MTDLVVLLVVFLTTVATALPAPRPSVCVAYNGKDTLAIPLTRDGNNIFTMKLFLRDQWIDGFAVDTGSHSILVSGEDCQKCAQQGPKKTVVYTSQSSTVRVERIPATIEAHRFSCGGGGGRVQPSTLLPTTSLCLNETDMNVALDFQGTSAYNVVGFGAHSSFLRSLMPSSSRAFSMHIHSLRHAELFVFAPGQCFAGARRFLLSQRGIPLDAVNGARDAKTRHVLLDTGSNALSLPEHVYAALPSRGTLRLTLGDDFVLPVPFDKANVGNAQIMSSPGNDRIVVGVTFLVGFAIGGVQERDGSAYVTIDRINDRP